MARAVPENRSSFDAFGVCWLFVCKKIEDIRREVARIRSEQPGVAIGFVPTMGALHDGHLSLIRASQRAGDAVVVSIFVNPTQFAPGEDFNAYPRPLQTDLAKCQTAGVAAVFHPPPEQMYGPNHLTHVTVDRLTDHLCGPYRAGHFAGVALVVTKLFNIVQPDRAYFGQKDAQQLAVIRQMVEDLNLPIQIVACPIVREPDGLAMSSRNAYLNPQQRLQAVALYRSLDAMRQAIVTGQRDPARIVREANSILEASGPCRIDYVELVDPLTMQPVASVQGPVLAAVAVWIGPCRLIDNLLIDAGPAGL